MSILGMSGFRVHGAGIFVVAHVACCFESSFENTQVEVEGLTPLKN